LFYLYYFYWVAFFAGVGALLIVVGIVKRWDYAKTVVGLWLYCELQIRTRPDEQRLYGAVLLAVATGGRLD
jgi:hypothetical protein